MSIREIDVKVGKRPLVDWWEGVVVDTILYNEIEVVRYNTS